MECKTRFLSLSKAVEVDSVKKDQTWLKNVVSCKMGCNGTKIIVNKEY